MQDFRSSLGLAPIALVAWYIVRTAYRVFFHPLAKIPGPKLAAVTTWYEGWYDVITGKGRFTFHLKGLHDKYGPIVRIGPNEVHVKDSDYYFELYNQTTRLDKYDFFYGMLGNDVALFPAIQHDIHKVRRAAVSPFFSTSAVNRFHPVVQQTTDRLCKRIEQNIKQKEPVPLFFAFRCVTVDIITEYLFGKQLDLVDRKDWGRSFYGAWRGLWEMSPLIRQWPWIMPLFRAAPRWLLAATNPKALEVVDMEVTCDEWTTELLASDPEEVKKQKYPTVLWEVYQSGQFPAYDMSIQRMSLLGSNTLAAGFETVGTALSHIIYGVLSDPAIHKRLLEELEEAIPDPDKIPSHTVLEKLPYLNAVIKEGVRQGVGAYGRLSRVNPKQPIKYKEWVIPPGSAIGMSAYYVLWDPEIYTDPGSFRPERWLDPESREKLDRYFIAFGRGPRSCVGTNLAYAELYTVLANIVRRFPTLSLFETEPEDVEAVHDFFGGMWRFEEGKWGLRVTG